MLNSEEMKKNLIYIINVLYLINILYFFASCEKDIDIDYHESEAVFVVEGSISNTGTSIRITKTQAMDDNSTSSDISNAIVVITSNDGVNETIPYKENGFYTSRLIGTPGTRYQLDIDVDGHHFTSVSTMQQMPQLNKFRIVRKDMLGENYIFGDIRIQDILNEDNWYFVHLYRNDKGYRWDVMRDDTNPNKELQQLLGFFREGANDSDVIHEGDRLHLVVRAIDQRAYDYLYSMERMDDTGTNPIANFMGGCLGYFSAYSEVAYDCVFHQAEIENEE